MLMVDGSAIEMKKNKKYSHLNWAGGGVTENILYSFGGKEATSI